MIFISALAAILSIKQIATISFKQYHILDLYKNYGYATDLLSIGVQEGILLGGETFALKITICPKNRQFALKIKICPKNRQFALKLTF